MNNRYTYDSYDSLKYGHTLTQVHQHGHGKGMTTDRLVQPLFGPAGLGV